jgi:hypothetical protein
MFLRWTYKENLEQTVDGEKVTEKVEILSLKRLGELNAVECVVEVDDFEEQLSSHLFQTGELFFSLFQVFWILNE